MTPFFSIIIPVYNVAPYLNECLDSVLKQSYSDWECIAVDDESSDESGEILEEYAKSDDRIRVIHQKNSGEGGARNTALSLAKGEWVFFLDGDDVMLDGALEQLSQSVDSDVNLLRFGFCNFEEGTKADYLKLDIKPLATTVDISRNIGMSESYTYVWQHLFRRNILAGMSFTEYKRGCDRVFLNNVLLTRVDSIKMIDCVCYGYRLRSGSAMNSIPSPQVLRDEMDHRLDIMEMIDASHKKVEYAGNHWLEKYFTRRFYQIVRTREEDRQELLSDWRGRLKRLRKVKGLSLYGRFIAWSCSMIRMEAWDSVVCYAIPRLFEDGSVFRCLKRKMGFVSGDLTHM